MRHGATRGDLVVFFSTEPMLSNPKAIVKYQAIFMRCFVR